MLGSARPSRAVPSTGDSGLSLWLGGGCHLPTGPRSTCSASSSPSSALYQRCRVPAPAGMVRVGLPRATGSAFPALGALAGTQQLVFLLVQSSGVSGHVRGSAQNVGAAQNQPGVRRWERQVKDSAPEPPDTAQPCLHNSGSHLNPWKMTFLVQIMRFPFLKSSASALPGNNSRTPKGLWLQTSLQCC